MFFHKNENMTLAYTTRMEAASFILKDRSYMIMYILYHFVPVSSSSQSKMHSLAAYSITSSSYPLHFESVPKSSHIKYSWLQAVIMPYFPLLCQSSTHLSNGQFKPRTSVIPSLSAFSVHNSPFGQSSSSKAVQLPHSLSNQLSPRQSSSSL